MSDNANNNRYRERRSGWQIFRAPVWVGVLSVVGLLAALIGDGVFDGLSWIALGMPTALAIWYGWWRPRLRKPH